MTGVVKSGKNGKINLPKDWGLSIPNVMIPLQIDCFDESAK